jgi:hypothetical protein
MEFEKRYADWQGSPYTIMLWLFALGKQKHSICDFRRAETLKAYQILGIHREDILRFDYSDYGVWPSLEWNLPTGETGTTSRFIPKRWGLKPIRLLLPNGSREHQDREAVFRIGAYDGPRLVIQSWQN